MSDGVKGFVYLIHFEDRVGSGARHYMGWAKSVEKRLADHRRSSGSKLLRAANRAGVGYEVVRVWEDSTRHDEARWKKGHLAQRCPLCRDGFLRRRNALQSRRRSRTGRADRPRRNPRGPL